MEFARIIEYSDIFPEDYRPDFSELIQGVNRKHLCILVSNMSNRLVGKPFFDNNLDPRKKEFDCIRFFLSGNNPEFFEYVRLRFDDLKNRYEKKGFVGNYIACGMSSVMEFQRKIFSLPPCNDDYSIDLENNIFKAFLLTNELVLKAKVNSDETEQKPLDLRFAESYLAYCYANEDVNSVDCMDAFRRQLVKSVYLFRYLFRDKRMKGIRRAFMTYYHLNNWSDYLVYHVNSLFFTEMNSCFLVVKGESKQQRKARFFIRRSSINYDEIIPLNENYDYLEFRSKPFIRFDRKTFAITNSTFLIEHMYNNLYFDLKRFRKESGFCSDDEFRSYWTTEFSQKFMFHRFVKDCLRGDEVVVLDGCDCDRIVKEKGLSGVNPPDFYIRTDKCCILFEFKDTMLGASIKDQHDANKLFNDIESKFLKSSKGKPKGIGQLMQNAKAIQKGKFAFDAVVVDMPIIPVLVVDNPTYVMRGMRIKLEYMMRDYCKQIEINETVIYPLILVDVATFELYRYEIKRDGFYKTFIDYYEKITCYGEYMTGQIEASMSSFTEYMKSKPISDINRVFTQIMNIIKRGMP